MKKVNDNRKYDISYLKELGKEDEFLVMLIDLFITSSQEDLKLFEKYFLDKNWKQLGNLAHKLRSRTQHFKMNELASSLEEIEMQCQQQMVNNEFKYLVEKTKNSYLMILKDLKEESLTLTRSKG